MVVLPFERNHPALRESRCPAVNHLNFLQRKFNSDKELQQQYAAVIEEYLRIGHMPEIREEYSDEFYLPHRALIKESSNATKVRVVFDGSANSSLGISLNDA